MTAAIAAVPISNFVFKRTEVSASKADTSVFLLKNKLSKPFESKYLFFIDVSNALDKIKVYLFVKKVEKNKQVWYNK